MALFKTLFGKQKMTQDTPKTPAPKPGGKTGDEMDLFAQELGAKAAAKAEPAAANDDVASRAVAPKAAAEPRAEAPKPRKAATKGDSDDYNASSIDVLEGLEPVRLRPGMYIGGTDAKALHHLFAEVVDNSMDEAVAGHATFIEVELLADGSLKVTDNGRGIPVDPHPKFKNKSALEVILTMLHSGAKFKTNAYKTSGGLHGVGVSVVNALSDRFEVEVARDKTLYRQSYSRGKPLGKLEVVGKAPNRRGTSVTFHPDPQIFGADAAFKPSRLMRMARSKAYLFGGVEIRWKCASELIDDAKVPLEAVFHFPGGLRDFVAERIEGQTRVAGDIFAGQIEEKDEQGHRISAVEWAVAWIADEDGFVNSYCNTVPTPEGGTHETGLRGALTKSLRAFGEMTGNKKAGQITADDVLASAAALLSVFIQNPEFQGQTKEKLSSAAATRVVENAVKDSFDHWLTANPKEAVKLLEWVIERAEERLKSKRDKEVNRQSATKKLRLPGKLADCSQREARGAEIFIVEGDSAGGSAKQARNRTNQAILPLRGKILNVANASGQKIGANQLLNDLTLALGCGTGKSYREEDLRYEKVIIMTDADVDGAHIASLLITFFYQQMPKLIDEGHLFVAVPPLYRLQQGAKILYARDDRHKDELLASEFKGKGKVEIGRFKGLGEMMAAQLKETTMTPGKRTLLKVVIDPDDREDTRDAVNQLMGTRPEARFQFIQENAEFVKELDI